MKLSIIIPVYNSHRVVRRQIKHFKKMNLPDDIEILFMDDGSDPSLRSIFPNPNLKNFRIYPTGDTRPWTQACAKNFGAEIATGEYIFITDIDHILPRLAIAEAHFFATHYRGDKMEFSREFAILNNHGDIIQDFETLREYGFRRNPKKGFGTYKHTNTFVMRKSIFWEIGGYPEDDCDVGRQDNRDDTHLHNRYRRHCMDGKCRRAEAGGVTYVFPAVAKDPKRLFHKLDRTI